MTIPITMRARNLYYCIVRHFPLRLLWCDLDRDEVRLEAGCTVLGPVYLGDRAVIGAGAVVLQDVPPGRVAIGNPARVIRRVV